MEDYGLRGDSWRCIVWKNVNGILIESDNDLWGYRWGGGISELDLNKWEGVFGEDWNGEVGGVEDDFIMSGVEDGVNKGMWFGGRDGVIF